MSEKPGERRPVGESCGCFISLDINEGETLKNADKKVYSAVVLSMKTRNSERNAASTGSFWGNP